MTDILEQGLGPMTSVEQEASEKMTNDASAGAAKALLDLIVPPMVEARVKAVAEGKARLDSPVDGMMMVAHEVNGVKYGVILHVQLGPCLDAPAEGDTIQ
jgi:hypothetical protein